MSALLLEVTLLGVVTVLCLERDMVDGQMTKASKQGLSTPPSSWLI